MNVTEEMESLTLIESLKNLGKKSQNPGKKLGVSVDSIAISEDGNKIRIVWNGNHESEFHASWLRFRCMCEVCHPGMVAGMWRNKIRDFGGDLAIRSGSVDAKGFLSLDFDGEIVENHVTRFSPDWLRAQCYCPHCLEMKLNRSDVITLNNPATPNGKKRVVKEMDWNSYENDKDQWLFNWMKLIFDHGLCIINNAPDGEELKKMALLLGDLLVAVFVTDKNNPDAVFDYLSTNNQGETIYNSASKTEAIGMHQDYTYHPALHATVGLQRCTRFDSCIEGGNSIVVDLFEAAAILKSESPKHFQTLCQVPTIFQYSEKNGHFWTVQKNVIVVDYYGRVVAINWSGDYVPELQVRGDDVDRYYDAYKEFAKIIEDREEIQHEYRHTPGRMSCFNNLRVAHRRNAFKQNGGHRMITCVCVNTTNMKAKYIKLGEKLGIEVIPPKIGNMSSF